METFISICRLLKQRQSLTFDYVEERINNEMQPIKQSIWK